MVAPIESVCGWRLRTPKERKRRAVPAQEHFAELFGIANFKIYRWNGSDFQPNRHYLTNALAVYAPVVVMGTAERETCLKALIAAGVADYVPRSEGCMSDALDLLENRLARRQRISESLPAKVAQEWSKDFAEVLRHELNNLLTGILGNAELLLAEIARKKDGKLPHGGLERVETSAALAMRMRETVSQLSHQWETRNDPVQQNLSASKNLARAIHLVPRRLFIAAGFAR